MFGEWLVNPGSAAAHYYLPGAARCLCELTRREDGAARPQWARNKNINASVYCGKCKELNEERWLHAYATGGVS